MNRLSRAVSAGLLVCLGALAPAAASAQSFAGFRAFGVPIDGIGARALALGNLGVGLAKVEVSATDPTASADLLIPVVSVSMQPTWGDFTLGTSSGSSTWTRFPLMALGYPVLSAGGAVTVSLSGFMEQRWVSEIEATGNLGGVNVPSLDRFESDGGSSVARLGWAHRLSDKAKVGLMGGTYLGRLDQTFTRTLDSLAVGGNIELFVEEGAWRYSGKSVTLGGSFDPSELVHVAGAVEWSGSLKATPLEETGGDVREYDVPVRFSLGATATLTSRLNVNTSLKIQDWSGASGYDPGALSSGSVSYGAGVEWHALQGETRSLPIRLGYRSVSLPFQF
ncbi:MAG: hypothetical protein ACR2QM_13925, partial [Longimicrobiales bacterium]